MGTSRGVEAPAPADSARDSGPDRRPAGVAAALALFVLVPVIAAGGLVTKPLNEAGLTVLVFALTALATLPALRGTRWWRAPAPTLLALFWIAFWIVAPRALNAAPDGRLGRKELTGLAVCTFVSLAAVALSRGTRLGVVAFRWGWVVALLLTGGIGVWEVLTGRHLWTPDWAPWRFGEGSVISSTFINPNNFSDALVGMLAGVVALHATAALPASGAPQASTAPPASAESRRQLRALRLVLTALAVFAVVLMMLTQSRGGLVGALVIGVLEVLRRRRMHGHARPLRQTLAEHRRAAALAGAGLVLVVAATFLVPTLAARNPVRAMLEVAFSEGQARSDTLRVSLINAALGYLRDSGWMGSGAGSFEPLFWNDPARGTLPATNLHNAFVELLSQYGVLVFAPYLALIVVLVATMLRRRPGQPPASAASTTPASAASTTPASPPTTGASGTDPAPATHPGHRPDAERLILRNELAGQLTAWALLGATASSALEIPFWWLTLANAVTLAWYLRRPTPAPPPASV